MLLEDFAVYSFYIYFVQFLYLFYFESVKIWKRVTETIQTSNK